MKKLFLLAAVLTCVSLPAFAFGAPAVELDGSTLGPGVTITEPIVHNTLNVQVNGNAFSFSHQFDNSGTRAKASVHMRTLGIVFQYFPFHGMFSLDAGGYYNPSKFTLTPTPGPNGDYHIGGNTYTKSQVGNTGGRITFKHFEPYFGIGLGNTVDNGHFTVTFRLGALYTASPKLDLYTSSSNTQIKNYIHNKQQKYQNGINGVKFYPVVGVGFAFKF